MVPAGVGPEETKMAYNICLLAEEGTHHGEATERWIWRCVIESGEAKEEITEGKVPE